MTIYISGAISGEDYEKRRNRFEEIENMLLSKGYNTINPWRNGVSVDAPHHVHMKADIKMLLECDFIYMMKGWQKSKGARLEHSVACACGLNLWYE